MSVIRSIRVAQTDNSFLKGDCYVDWDCYGVMSCFLAKKATQNLHVPKRQLYAYAANDSTQNL